MSSQLSNTRPTPLPRSAPTSLALKCFIATFGPSRLASYSKLRGCIRGEADLLIGGPPCTPFRRAATGLNISGQARTRARICSTTIYVSSTRRGRRAFLLENVFGLAYRNHNAFWLKRLLSTFQELGYHTNRRVLLAADYGVPQRRQRLFILGSMDRTLLSPIQATAARTRLGAGTGASRTTYRVVTQSATLPDRDELAEPEELVSGTYADLLPQVPPGRELPLLYCEAKAPTATLRVAFSLLELLT